MHTLLADCHIQEMVQDALFSAFTLAKRVACRVSERLIFLISTSLEKPKQNIAGKCIPTAYPITYYLLFSHFCRQTISANLKFVKPNHTSHLTLFQSIASCMCLLESEQLNSADLNLP